MKTVHVVEFGCNLTSDPLGDGLAEELKQRLEDKGLQCYIRDLEYAVAQPLPTSTADDHFIDFDDVFPLGGCRSTTTGTINKQEEM